MDPHTSSWPRVYGQVSTTGRLYVVGQLCRHRLAYWGNVMLANDYENTSRREPQFLLLGELLACDKTHCGEANLANKKLDADGN